jgi:hypothetical protein
MTKPYIQRCLLKIAVAVSMVVLGLLPVGALANDLKITVHVKAKDPAGNPLTYRWRSTDGRIVDQDAPWTKWTLPAGPGIHFAYVLVSNGKGGYTERRIAVNTDGLSRIRHTPPMELVPPPAAASSTVPFRAWIGGGSASYTLGGVGGVTGNFKVALPDVKVLATGSPNLLQESSSTSLSGDLTFQAFSPQRLDISCTITGVAGFLFPCLGVDASFQPVPDEVVDVEANQTNRVNLLENTNQVILAWVTGAALLEDGSTCGTENEFFGVTSTATAELIDIDGNPIPGTRVRANSWGQFSTPLTQSVHTSVVVHCEDAPLASQTGGSVEIPRPSSDSSKSFDVGVVTISGGAPVVSSMFVTPATVPAKFDDPTMRPPLPSDIVPLRPAKFLAMKGLDTRLSGCLYYKTIGAVWDCDTTKENFLVGAVSFEDWKRTVKIDRFAPPGAEYRALFVNRVDLNLTREHHSVSHLESTAGYVCNHLGPQGPTQADVDKAIENAAAGKDLVACVAMDYTFAPGVNNGKPFTRFLIFGPSGELLPSVNLDGRGEKFVPGTCVVCHGGNKYAGKFPEDKTGTADLDAHFLPFDTGNFEFHSSRPGFRKPDQQEAIYQLNQNVLNTNTNRAERELIAGWYPPGPHIQKEDFLPPGATPDFYLNVIARSCRTCHIAQRDELSIRDLTFSKAGSVTDGALSIVLRGFKELVCGQTDDLVRAYAMPNSAVTFDLFWKSNQPQKVATMRGLTECKNPKAP